MKQQRVYQQLRRAIYAGEIKQGEKLVERRLAQEFATSRGPLRESLLRLMSEGLVRRSPRRTSYVQEMTSEDVRDIYLMRMTLEPTAARLVARQPKRRALVKQLLSLTDLMTREMEKQRPIESAEADFEFHRQIVHASGSVRLIRAYELSHVPMLISQLSEEWGRPESLHRIHLEIAQHIENGADDEAEQAARRHVERAAQRNFPT